LESASALSKMRIAVLNALIHTFGSGERREQEPSLRLEGRREDQNLVLRVIDRGGAASDERRDDSLTYSLVESLLKQLDGKMEVRENELGRAVEVTIPKIVSGVTNSQRAPVSQEAY